MRKVKIYLLAMYVQYVVVHCIFLYISFVYTSVNVSISVMITVQLAIFVIKAYFKLATMK